MFLQPVGLDVAEVPLALLVIAGQLMAGIKVSVRADSNHTAVASAHRQRAEEFTLAAFHRLGVVPPDARPDMCELPDFYLHFAPFAFSSCSFVNAIFNLSFFY